MINTEDFIKRLQKVIDYYGESASSFAEKIGVQRSSISHILSGRNKPSLDFILKILAYFPDVDLYWLCNGKGHFPNEEKNKYTKTDPESLKIKNTLFTNEETETSNLKEGLLPIEVKKDKAIDRIVIFYADGSFKSYDNGM